MKFQQSNISEFCYVLITIFYEFMSSVSVMSLHVWYVHIESMTKELESKMCNFWIILSSCENWVTQISKILIQLNSFSHQYVTIILSNEYFNMPMYTCHQNVQRSCKQLNKKCAISDWVTQISKILILHVLITIFYECMFSLQFSTICVQLHSCHLYMSLHLWYVHIESMTKELESKMCNFSSFWVVVRTG